jgi:hypothetical protein
MSHSVTKPRFEAAASHSAPLPTVSAEVTPRGASPRQTHGSVGDLRSQQWMEPPCVAYTCHGAQLVRHACRMAGGKFGGGSGEARGSNCAGARGGRRAGRIKR